ncbi:hypothetical protein [Roseateles sp.]|uniref:hypothetical protein n=1 Tax=Roseateles sp. TaxID=1971397 RepID=UPI0031DAF577
MRSIVLSTVLMLGGVWSGAAVATSPPVQPSPAEAEQASAKKEPTEWRRWWGGWVRLEAEVMTPFGPRRDLSCLSPNGTDCYWSGEVTDPEAFPESTLKPLVCGTDQMQALWGVNGYNDGFYDRNKDGKSDYGELHWCRSAYATKFLRPEEWTDYSMLGARHWLAETPAGDLMCHSTDGLTCTPVAEGDTVPPPAEEIHPVVCGAHHRWMHGHDGYSTPGHWCQMPKIDTHHPKLKVTDHWREDKTVGWMAAIEPAFVARVKVPAGRTLTLRAHGLFENASAVGLPPVKEKKFFGLEFGQQLRFHLGDRSEHFVPRASWTQPLPHDGAVIVGTLVTSRKNACFFGARVGGEGKGLFNAPEALIGNSLAIRDEHHRPVLFEASAEPMRPGERNTLFDWRADAGPEFEIEEVLMLYARPVPQEHDLKKRRFISYSNGCDEK